MRLAPVLAAALMVLAGCGSARRGAPFAPVPDPEEPELRLGRRVFATRCHQCHPGGAAGLGFALNDKPLPGALIRFQVRNGIGVMPAFSEAEISDRDLDALVAWVLHMRRLPSPGEARARR